MIKIYLSVILLLLTSSLSASNFAIITGPYLPKMRTNILKDKYTGDYFTYSDFYGKKGTYLNIIHIDYSLARKYGEFSIVGEAGFTYDRGKSLINSTTGYQSSGQKLTLYIIPVNIGATYYFCYLNNQLIVPFIEGGGSYWYFDEKKENGPSTQGGKRGWFYGVGIKFLMDILEPSAAASLRIDYGINHTYLVGGYRVYKIYIPQPGFNFSDKTWYVGLSFNY